MLKKDLIVKELKKIKAKNKHHLLQPEEVLEYAENEDSALHSRFCWDDTKAAREYRLWQARELVANVRIEYDGEIEKHYYHCRVVINDEKIQGYVTPRDFTNEDIYKSVLKEAVTSLKYWQTKYNELKELKNIIDEEKLKEVEKKVK
jgi:hypothetical protein